MIAIVCLFSYWWYEFGNTFPVSELCCSKHHSIRLRSDNTHRRDVTWSVLRALHLDVSTPDNTSAVLGVFGPQAGRPLHLLTSSSTPLQPYFPLNPQQHVRRSRQTCTQQTLGRNHSVTFLVLSLLKSLSSMTHSLKTPAAHTPCLSLRAQCHFKLHFVLLILASVLMSTLLW